MDEVLKNILITAGIFGSSITGFVYGVLIGKEEMRKTIINPPKEIKSPPSKAKR